MSATGRGRERAPFDYYPTPPWCVHRLLDRCADGLGIVDGSDVLALEPTCGDGAIIRAVDSWPLLRPASALPEWTGVELRRGALDPTTRVANHVEGVDFRSWEPEQAPFGGLPFDIVIGNPPFALAEPIIRHAMTMAPVVVMLLRLGFLGSAERIPFWTEHSDPALRVIPDRPSFDGEGTDSSTYAWFVWGCYDVQGVEVLDETPASIRAAQKPAEPDYEPPQANLFGGL